MAKDKIRQFINEAVSSGNFDVDMLKILLTSLEKSEEGKETGKKILDLIRNRYVKAKENKN